MILHSFLNAVSGVVWGAPMLIFFLFTGLRFSFKSSFFQITGTRYIIKEFFKSLKSNGKTQGLSQFSTICSVLGACMGTGNIVGVATAIYSGGPGVVVWMVISAVISMMTSYAENFLGSFYTQRYSYKKSSVGVFAYIENGLGMNRLAKGYAVLFLLSACGMGNMAQSNSLTQALCSNFKLSSMWVSLIATVLTLLVITGGLKRISKLQTILVPFSTLFYFILCFLVLFKFKENILPAIIIIFKEAFTLNALKGFGMYKAIRFGIARGVFSNEAGLGSSTILHAQASSQKHETQGISAIIEIFIDTVFMCSLTALVIIVSTNIYENKLFGAQLSISAFSKIGALGSNGVCVLTAVFAFMSLCSYAFYAEKSIEYLIGHKNNKYFKYIYAILVFIGGVSSSQSVWLFADICNGLMALPNLFALNCLHKEIEYPKIKRQSV